MHNIINSIFFLMKCCICKSKIDEDAMTECNLWENDKYNMFKLECVIGRLSANSKGQRLTCMSKLKIIMSKLEKITDNVQNAPKMFSNIHFWVSLPKNGLYIPKSHYQQILDQGKRKSWTTHKNWKYNNHRREFRTKLVKLW